MAEPSTPSDPLPILAYETQPAGIGPDWAVRFFGVWTICASGTSTLRFILGATIGSAWMLMPGTMLAFLADLASTLFGIAILRQRRGGYYGRLGALILATLFRLMVVPYDRLGLRAIPSVASILIPAVTAGIVVVSLLRNAESRGVLRPPLAGHPISADPSGAIPFLITRIGWIQIGTGISALVHLATARIPRSAPLSSVSTAIALLLAGYVCAGGCGVLLGARRFWALWLLAAIQPIMVALRFSDLWPRIKGGTAFLSVAPEMIPATASAATAVALLWILAMKATTAQTASAVANRNDVQN